MDGEKKQALSDQDVTGYTASLWRDLPVPAGEPEPAPEYAYTTAELPGGRLVAAQVRGKKHRHEGTNCDDWYEFASVGKINCIAVSDGAGSKKFSRIGARESCRAAAGSMEKLLREALSARPELWEQFSLPLSESGCMEACSLLAGILQRSVLTAAEAVETACEARRAAYSPLLGRELMPSDFSGTLLAAVLIPTGGGECLAAACQVGDGVIALLDTRSGPAVKLLGAADSGAFSGETVFLTSPLVRQAGSLQSRTRIAKCAAGLALVMTDGVSDDYFPPETELPRLYRDLTAAGILEEREDGMSPGLRLKRWLESYVERGSFDDRTLLILRM